MRLLAAKSDNLESIRLGMSRWWLVNTVRLPENDLLVKGIRKDMYKKGLVMKKGYIKFLLRIEDGNSGKVYTNIIKLSGVKIPEAEK